MYQFKHCGKQLKEDKQPRGKKKRRWALRILLGIVALTVFLIIMLSDFSGDNHTPEVTESEPITPVEEYQGYAVLLEYRKAALQEYQIGQLIQLTGEITYSDTNLFGKRYYLLATKYVEYLGYVQDIVYVRPAGQWDVLAGDIVQIYGKYEGSDSDHTPEIYAEHLKIEKQRD